MAERIVGIMIKAGHAWDVHCRTKSQAIIWIVVF